jgi:hypothetical protein
MAQGISRARALQGGSHTAAAAAAATTCSSHAAAACSSPAASPAFGRVAPIAPCASLIVGSKVPSQGKLKYPAFMDWDHHGNAVVADTDNHRLQVFRLSDGACLRIIGSEGSCAGQFKRPYGVAFDSAGLTRRTIKCRCSATATAATYEPLAAKAVQMGVSSCSVLVGGQGRIVVGDFFNHRIQVLQ